MIPESTLQLARDMLALQARALAEHKMLADAANQASGAEAVGKAALAAELEQVGKVLSNYMPRIMKHVGEIQPLPAEDPNEPDGFFDVTQLADLIRENEPHAEAQVRWLKDYSSMTNQLVDSRLPPLTDSEREYHGRLQRALYKTRSGAVEVI